MTLLLVVDKATSRAKIDQHHIALRRDDDILGFDIPMEDMIGMDMLYGLAELGDIVDGFLIGQRASLIDNLLEGASRHEVHHDIGCAVRIKDIVNVHNVGVVEFEKGACLIVETLAILLK